MQLVELHWVKTELNISGWLEQERLILLVCSHLNSDVSHLVEHLTPELLDKELRVWYHLPSATRYV